MKRYLVALVAASAGLLLLLITTYALLDSPPEQDNRMARARALYDTANYLTALEVLRDVSAGAGDTAEAHVYLGAAYLRLHLYSAALREFEASSRQRPGSLDPWIGLASTYIRLGDGARAREQAARATEVADRSAEAWMLLGRAHWLERNYTDARTAALRAQELDPDDPNVRELLLRIYFDLNDAANFRTVLDRMEAPSKPVQDLAVRFYIRQGEFRRANELRVRFDRRNLEREMLQTELALAREPDRIDLYPALVRNAIDLGRFEEALDAVRRYTGPVNLSLEVGKAHMLAGRREEAMRALERASAGRAHKLSAEIALAVLTRERRHWQQAFNAERIEQDYFVLAQLEDVMASASPIEKAFIYRYAGIYDPVFYNKAAEAALAVLNEAPADYDALMTIATAYHRLGRIEDAMRYVEQGRDAYPDRAEPWSRLGSLALAANDVPTALAAMERAARLEPQNPSYLYNYGWAQDQMGRTDEAVAYYRRAIAASPLSFEAMNNLAVIYGDTGRTDLALTLLTDALAVDSENEAPHINLANYHAKRRSWRQALESYRHALDLNPLNVAAAVEAGRIYLELGRGEQAVEMLSRALDIDSHAFDAYLVLASAYQMLGHYKEASGALDEAARIRPGAPEIDSARAELKEPE